MTCPKMPHTRGGEMHGPDDDRPYEVDGLLYCGRCHYSVNATTRLCENPATVSRPVVASEGGTRDWTEDFAHENGQYQCKCLRCGEFFTGHKRRVICKACVCEHHKRGESCPHTASCAPLPFEPIVLGTFTLPAAPPAEAGREPVTASTASQYEMAIRWALGEVGEFRERRQGEGAWYWRTELRKRAGLSLTPQPSDAPTGEREDACSCEGMTGTSEFVRCKSCASAVSRSEWETPIAVRLHTALCGSCPAYPGGPACEPIMCDCLCQHQDMTFAEFIDECAQHLAALSSRSSATGEPSEGEFHVCANKVAHERGWVSRQGEAFAMDVAMVKAGYRLAAARAEREPGSQG